MAVSSGKLFLKPLSGIAVVLALSRTVEKLLAHPRGTIAYIGHLDTALLCGFVDVGAPHILDRWHTRIAPFKSALDRLLKVQPSGLAMHDMVTLIVSVMP